MAQSINNQSSTDYQIHTDTQSKYITSTMYALLSFWLVNIRVFTPSVVQVHKTIL